jgi:hypothetical protein
MPTQQGSVALLNDPIARELLQSTNPARLAYVWHDGTPRVVPIWFHWNGSHVVLGTPVEAPKVRLLSPSAAVAVSIDGNTFPYRVLQIRGAARVEIVPGVAAEYAAAAERYFGAAQGQAWVAQMRSLTTHMARISIEPQWVAILDFEKRFPSAIESAMAAAAARG